MAYPSFPLLGLPPGGAYRTTHFDPRCSRPLNSTAAAAAVSSFQNGKERRQEQRSSRERERERHVKPLLNAPLPFMTDGLPPDGRAEISFPVRIWYAFEGWWKKDRAAFLFFTQTLEKQRECGNEPATTAAAAPAADKTFTDSRRASERASKRCRRATQQGRRSPRREQERGPRPSRPSVRVRSIAYHMSAELETRQLYYTDKKPFGPC